MANEIDKAFIKIAVDLEKRPVNQLKPAETRVLMVCRNYNLKDKAICIRGFYEGMIFMKEVKVEEGEMQY